MSKAILRARSIVPALDFTSMEDLNRILKATAHLDFIGGYKLGFSLSYMHSMPKVVAEIKKAAPDKIVVLDHQKAGTDIPKIGKLFAKVCAESAIDMAILFPQSGPETEKAWIEALKERDVGVIVGIRMTHDKYLDTEGGWISSDKIMNAFTVAVENGCKDFVGPGNKPEFIAQILAHVKGMGVKSPVMWAPGLIAQGGKITDAGKAAGDRFHAIIGEGIYEAKDPEAAAKEYGSQL